MAEPAVEAAVESFQIETAKSKGKKWTSISFEIVTAAVGLGSFALPKTVGNNGVVLYIGLVSLIAFVNYRACTWWKEHRDLWNKRKQTNPDMPEFVTYEDWGVAAMGSTGKLILQFCQVGNFLLVCAVFMNLFNQQVNSTFKFFDPSPVKDGAPTDVMTTLKNGNFMKASLQGADAVYLHSKASGELTCKTDKTVDVSIADIGSLSDDDMFEWTSISGDDDIAHDDLVRLGKCYFRYGDLNFDPDPLSGPKKYSLYAVAVVLFVFTLFQENIDSCKVKPEMKDGKSPSLGLYGNAGTLGVIISWSTIIGYTLFIGRAKESTTSWFENPAIMQPEDYDYTSFFQLFTTALGSWGVIGLVPDYSRGMDNVSNLKKALKFGHAICMAVYFLPLLVYFKYGNEPDDLGRVGDVLDLIRPDDNETTTKVMAGFLIGSIIINMIASYVLVLRAPLNIVEGVLEECFAKKGKMPYWSRFFMVRLPVRFLFIVLHVLINTVFSTEYDMMYRVASCIFPPFTTVILPVIFDLMIKKEYGNEVAAGGFVESIKSRMKPIDIRSTVEWIVILIVFVISVVNLPLNLFTELTDFMEKFKLTLKQVPGTAAAVIDQTQAF